MKRWHKSFLISIVILIFIVSAFAQKGTSIVTRIKFARGRTTTVERGSVHRGMSHDYLLKAGAGQNISIFILPVWRIRWPNVPRIGLGTCRGRVTTGLMSSLIPPPSEVSRIRWK